MRRQGQFQNSGSDPYVAAQMQQQMERTSGGEYQVQLEAFTPERDDPFATSKEGQQGWDRDRGGSAPSTNPIASHLYYDGQGGDASRSFYQGLRAEQIQTSEKRTNNESTRSQSHDKLEVNAGGSGYEKMQSFEGLEQKFVDDIVKLTKELNDTEDAENARHREKLNSIDNQYQKQLEALRTRHASRRDEFLRKETSARQQQYQQAILDQYPTNRVLGPRDDPQGYGNIAGPISVGEAQHHQYNPDLFDSYGDRARFSRGGPRDHSESRGPYPGARSYDTGSRFY